ncbi:MAG: hypothetical protein DME25_02890 [Verrucomicrobia bacterium]|nr:MAG: hypothetical protein DME25_02890 [Verrucomicrobiota bacterium]
MKVKWFLGLLVAACVVAGLIVAYVVMSQERKAEAEREKPVSAKSRVSVGSNGETIITLDAETQKRIALSVEPAKPATIQPELKGYGRVLDPAPLAALVGEGESAQAALAASQKEFERLRLLNEQKSASDRALQAAEAAARHDQILLAAARTRLVSAWGNTIAEQSDLPALVLSLASLRSALVRVDLPAGETIKAPPATARLVPGTADKDSITAELVGPAPSVDPQVQGQAFLFLVKSNSFHLAPGTALAAFLLLPGEPLQGCLLPDSTVVRHASQSWAYVQTSDNTFTRREIKLDQRMEAGWFVKDGIAAHERVVVSGAQALLSEEQKYQIRQPE